MNKALLALALATFCLRPSAASECPPMTYVQVGQIVADIAKRVDQKASTEADVATLRLLARCFKDYKADSRTR